jgi:hypothetical protein
MGEFMSKQLRLKDLRDFCIDTWHEDKIVIIDEDNIASCFKDEEAWTIHRKRAWTTLFSGAHYDYIDFSIVPHAPAGTPQSRRYIRTWFKFLQEYVRNIDIENSAPVTGFVSGLPEFILPSVFGNKDEIHIYLADSREREEPGCGDLISGLKLELPLGEYEAAVYSPVSGQSSPIVRIMDQIELPGFNHDIVIKLVRVALS